MNYEDGKFSKSRGVGVFGNNAKETGIPADVWRFYLLYVRPESQDSTFSWNDLMLKNNSELLNNIGNFANRALSFLEKNYGGVVPTMTFGTEEQHLLVRINRELNCYLQNLEQVKLREGLRPIFSISRLGNQLMQSAQPWVLIKGSEADKMRAGTVIALCSNIICLLSVLLLPYMPETSRQLQSQLNVTAEAVNVLVPHFVCRLPAGHRIGKPAPLFQKIEKAQVDELKLRYVFGKMLPEYRLMNFHSRFAGTQKDQEERKKQEATPPPAAAAPPAPSRGQAAASPEEVAALTQKVTEQGDKVRQLKTSKAEKSAIDKAVAELLNLKKQLCLAEGKDANAAAPAASSKSKKKGAAKK